MDTKTKIKSITREHLLNGGLLYAQCVTAVGWIGGTVPDDLPDNKGIIELPTSDVSNSGIVTGAALMGRRPIYVIRYQGFVTYNSCSILNYAAKSKEMWGKWCPVFVRGLSMEGSMGPVATGAHHSVFMRMPGIKVVAPMTSGEWEEIWNDYMNDVDPFFCSESRLSFNIDYEMPDVIHDDAEVSIFAISSARLNLRAIIDKIGVKCNSFKVLWLKPTFYTDESLAALKKSKFGVVIDSDFSICGASQSIAYELMHKTGKPVYALGLEDRTAGFAPYTDNVTPKPEDIVKFIKEKYEA